MKFICAVCEQRPATVLCTADDAAMCSQCDHDVHLANKLAHKHERTNLVEPASSSRTVCDICQENPGHIFCMEDRAVLCVGCDVSIHTANAHTEKHNRFVLSRTSVCLGGCDKKCEPAPKSSSSNAKGKNKSAQGAEPVQSNGKGKDARVDELLNAPGLADGYHLDDFGDFGTFDDNFDFAALLEVPDLMSSVPPNNRKHERVAEEYSSDDGCVVPDIDFQSKRRRENELGTFF